MFVTEKLNLTDGLIQDAGFSKALVALFEQDFINLEFRSNIVSRRV